MLGVLLVMFALVVGEKVEMVAEMVEGVVVEVEVVDLRTVGLEGCFLPMVRGQGTTKLLILFVGLES